MTPSQLSVVSTSPVIPLGEDNTEETLTVTFNRSLTNSEISQFSATLVVVLEGDEAEYNLANGVVTYQSTSRGSYSISGKNLVITMTAPTTFWDFELNS